MFFNNSNKNVDKFAQEHGYKGAKYIGNNDSMRSNIS